MRKLLFALGAITLAASPTLAAEHQHGQKYECERMEDGTMKCCQPGEDGKMQCQTMSCPMSGQGHTMGQGQMGPGQGQMGQGHMMGQGQMNGQGHMMGQGQTSGQEQEEHKHQ